MKQLLSALLIGLMAVTACQKSTEESPANVVTNAGKKRNDFSVMARQALTGYFTSPNGNQYQIAFGTRFNTNNPDGSVRWDCFAVASVCNISRTHLVAPGNPHAGNADWVEDQRIKGIWLYKTPDNDAFIRQNAGTGDYLKFSRDSEMAIYDTDLKNPSRTYRIVAGSYALYEVSNAYLIVFEEKK